MSTNCCRSCGCAPCCCGIPGPRGATGPTGPAGEGVSPVFGSLYSLLPFDTPLQLTPPTILPTEYAGLLSDTQFDDGSLIIPSGVYLGIIKTFATATSSAIINVTISLDGLPVVGGQLVQRAPLTANVGQQIYSSFYVGLSAGTVNIVAWANTPVEVEFFETALYMVKIADYGGKWTGCTAKQNPLGRVNWPDGFCLA